MEPIIKRKLDKNVLRVPINIKAALMTQMSIYDITALMGKTINEQAEHGNMAIEYVENAISTLADNEDYRIETFDKTMENNREKLDKIIEQIVQKVVPDGSVVMNKLGNDVKNVLGDLQDQIDEMRFGAETVSVTVSPSVVFVGDSTNFSITAKSSKAMNIKINCSGILYNSAGKVTTYTAVTEDISFLQANTSMINVEFVLNSNKKNVSASVTAVNKIYYGGAAAYTDLTNDEHALATPKTSAGGNYQIQVAENGMYIFWIVPATMGINKALIDNNPLGELPLTQTAQEVGGVQYKVYKSNNAVMAGTYNITLS